jgi:hypothetical protein
MTPNDRPLRIGLALLGLFSLCCFPSCRDSGETSPTPPKPRPVPAANNEGIPPNLIAEFANVSAPDSAQGSTSDAALAWNRKSLIGAYIKSGRRRPEWNLPASLALEAYARVRQAVCAGKQADESLLQDIKANCRKAVEAGCNDALILYLHARYVKDQPITELSAAQAYEIGESYSVAARELEKTTYPPLRKFHAQLHASEFIRIAFKKPYGRFPNPIPREWKEFHSLAIPNLEDALQDAGTPIAEVEEACEGILHEFTWYTDARLEHARRLEPLLSSNWPNASYPGLFKGTLYFDLAWQARGTGYANTVSPEGWKRMAECLTIAEESLANAWNLNSSDARIPIKMMSVELGQGRGRERLELWFGRAMAIDPNSYEACASKRYYLEPKWYGSGAEMLKFGRECVQSKEWGHRVGRILADAHVSLAEYLEPAHRPDYWKQPNVWPDIQMSFDRLLLDSSATPKDRNLYARFAAWCGQWSAFNRLISEVGEVDYDLFGGKAEFDRLVELARSQAGGAAVGVQPP